jgi:uncharacterized lipoprotein YmbA
MTPLSRAVLAAACLLATACGTLSRPPLVKETYLITAARPVETSASARPGVLRIGLFNVAQPYAGKPMVYRFDELRYEADVYHEHFVAPRDIVTQRVFEWMQNARVFEASLLVGAGPQAEGPSLTGLVTELYGDLRDPQHPAAVLAVQFYLSRETGRGNEVLFAQQLRESVQLEDPSAASLARGWSQALTTILAEFEKQLRAAPLASR